MPRAPIDVAAIVLTILLAGCAGLAEPTSAEVETAPAPPRPMDWSPGSWWSYHATIGNATIDLAMIVHEAHDEGYHLGTNLSIGFFGLPFTGNVTEQHNPRIGTDVWPLFEFPLADGKEWAYELFGYQAKTIARESVIDVPGLGLRPGYSLESTSFGAVFARYDYAPDAGWFTRLELIEPTDGTTVLLAELTAFGHDWASAYYVEETLQTLRVDYPTIPGALHVAVPDGYLQARATLTAHLQTGALSATLRDDDGRALARVDALVRGADIDRASTRPDGATTWRLDHRGAGLGAIVLELSGVSATGPLAAPSADAPAIDLAALLQSSFPV